MTGNPPPQPYSFDRPLVLVGMPGCGKSTIGQRLAQSLYLPFYDSDGEVVLREGKTVPEIFSERGEETFRAVEAEVISEIIARGAAIVATGGGALLHPGTRRLLKQRSLTVWLRVSVETLLERVSRSHDRPLLQSGDKASILRDHHTVREPLYAAADIRVNADAPSHDEVVEAVLTELAAYNARIPLS